MGRPSQSQDVEHKGPRSNPLNSRKRRARDSSDKSVQDELDQEAEPGPRQHDEDSSTPSQHGANTPSRPD